MAPTAATDAFLIQPNFVELNILIVDEASARRDGVTAFGVEDHRRRRRRQKRRDRRFDGPAHSWKK